MERGSFLASHHCFGSAFEECSIPHFHCAKESSSELPHNRGNWKSEFATHCLNLSLLAMRRWVRALTFTWVPVLGSSVGKQEPDWRL